MTLILLSMLVLIGLAVWAGMRLIDAADERGWDGRDE